MLEELVPRGAMSFHWRVFGNAERKTYEPIPVTKRFLYRTPEDYGMNKQVKPIAYMPDYDWEKKVTTPHYAPIKKGIKYLGPVPDVAVIHHYRFKSKMEYIRKRLKGDVHHGRMVYLKEALNGTTQNGDAIPNGTIFDDRAWQILKDVAPRYRMYDDFYQIPSHIK